jgi:hypothetical protein
VNKVKHANFFPILLSPKQNSISHRIFYNKISKDLVNSVNIGCGLQVNDAAVIFGLWYSFLLQKIGEQTGRGGGRSGTPSLSFVVLARTASAQGRQQVPWRGVHNTSFFFSRCRSTFPPYRRSTSHSPSASRRSSKKTSPSSSPTNFRVNSLLQKSHEIISLNPMRSNEPNCQC